MIRCLIAVLLILGWFSKALAIQDPVGDRNLSGSAVKNALRLAPWDADYFYSSMQLRQQRDRFWNSACLAALRDSAIAKELTRAFLEQWEQNESLKPLRIGFNAPVGKRLRQLVDDMFSQEVFVVADSRFAPCFVRLRELQLNLAELQDPQELALWLPDQGKQLIQSIPVPTVAVGFAVANQDRTLDFVDRIHGLLSFLPEPFQRSLQRVEDQRGTRLTLRLHSEMIPADSLIDQWLPGDSTASGLIRDLLQALHNKQLTITIGQLDEYFLFAISENAGDVSQLGQQTPSLLDHEACRPAWESQVWKDAADKLWNVTYRSDAMAQGYFDVFWNHFFERTFSSLLQDSLLYSEESMVKLLEPLEEDLPWMDDEIRQHIPKYQGSMQLLLAREKGWEMWQFDRTAPILVDGTQSLSVLEHCGTKPIALLAGRHQYHPEWFQLSRKIVRRVRTYLELALAEQVVTGNDARELELVLKNGWPALSQLADLIEQKFLPATKDGQFAWVLGSRQVEAPIWWNGDAANGSIPFPEMATITSLTDKGKFVEGCIGVFGVADRFLDLASEVAPEKFPRGIVTPRPHHNAGADEDCYTYTVPRAMGLPDGFEPQVRLDKDWVICALADEFADSLQSRKVLDVGDGLLNAREKMGAVAYLDGGELAKLMVPWVRHGLETYVGASDTEWLPMQDSISVTTNDLVDALQAFARLGRWTSVTRMASEGVVVTHTCYEE